MAGNLEEIDIELFIGAVQEHPAIWNVALEDYHDRNKKRNAWTIIGRQFQEGFAELEDKEKNLICNTLIKKWKNIKDNFMKSVKKKTKSGQAADSGRRYIYARQLSFLQQAGATTDTQSSVAVDDAEETLEHEEATHETLTRQAEVLRPPRYEPRRSNKRKRDVEAQLIEFMKALIPPTTVTAPPEINPDRSFFESLLPSVSAFTEDQKLEFRCEVLNTIKRLRMSQQTTQFNPQFNVRQQEMYTGYASTISPHQPQPHPQTAVNFYPLTPSHQHVPRLTELRTVSFPTPHVASATLPQPSPTWSQTSTTLSQPSTSGLNTQPTSPSYSSVSQDFDREEESIDRFSGSEVA